MNTKGKKLTIRRIAGIAASALAILIALLWAAREFGLIQLEKPDNLLVPAMACAIIGLVLFQMDKRSTNKEA